mgnify:CR=1 FL=1
MTEINPTIPVEQEPVVITKNDYDEVVEKLASKTQNESNLVAEIKELREKKQLSEAEAENLKKMLAKREESQTPEELNPTAVEEIARKTLAVALAERDEETTKSARNSAMLKFVNQHKEFHPDNDVAGIKMALLEKKLNMFDMSNLRSESEFSGILEDASQLIGGTVSPKGEPTDLNPSEPTGEGGAEPKEAPDDKLNAKELKIIDRAFGGDKERYLKQKAKRPDYIRTLLQYTA